MIKLCNLNKSIYLTEKELQEQIKSQGWIYNENDWGKKTFTLECRTNPISANQKCIHKKCINISNLGNYCWKHTDYMDSKINHKQLSTNKTKPILNRVFWTPNSNTYLIYPIKKLLKKYINSNKNWIDPFAGDGDIAEFTNDIDSDSKAQYHIDALQFLSQFPDNSMEGILLNPPFSFHQVYNFTKNKKIVNISPIDAVYKQADRLLKKNGLAIHFGWNSNGIGTEYGYMIEELLIVPRGRHHNDLIVTVERKKI